MCFGCALLNHAPTNGATTTSNNTAHTNEHQLQQTYHYDNKAELHMTRTTSMFTNVCTILLISIGTSTTTEAP